MGWESFDVVRFDLRPFLRGQTWIAKCKVLINRFFLVLGVCNVKPSHRKSCARNLALFQGQMRIAKIKSAYNLLIRVPRGLQCHANQLETMG